MIFRKGVKMERKDKINYYLDFNLYLKEYIHYFVFNNFQDIKIHIIMVIYVYYYILNKINNQIHILLVIN